VVYFREAVDLGNAIGDFNYGLCCYKGEGICLDFGEVSKSFKPLADQNYPPAQLAVGFCYNRVMAFLVTATMLAGISG
jgi:TPR repeat protein